MAANPDKQVPGLDDRIKYESWDCHHDISIHLRTKSRNLQSRNDKLSFFTSLSEALHVQNPLADPDVVHYLDDLYDSVKSQLLHLLEVNRAVSPDVSDDNDDHVPYKFFLDHLRLDGKSYALVIPEDGVYIKYEAEEPEDSTLPTTTRSESNLDDRTRLISIDTNLNSEAEQLRKSPGRKQKQPLQTIVDPKATTRRGRKPKQPLALSTDVRSNVDLEVKEEEDEDDHLPDLKRPLIKQPEPVVNVDRWWEKQKARARKHTAFRDKLMGDLRRPYSEDEYRMLLKQLSEKKPVKSQRVLRSCTKSYDDDTRPPKSILDYHADLAKRIDSVRDDHPEF
ncbi:uncharacterized protein LOC114741011 [Neltuma alba]|uniref:uncharacterized protein LOC114741011 n=1 Tax=Neltuma alba TaxID=207710 RepID=UPI0010A314A9|nr:uncharacterized protein LOC114741011 [Prosopis alba]